MLATIVCEQLQQPLWKMRIHRPFLEVQQKYICMLSPWGSRRPQSHVQTALATDCVLTCLHLSRVANASTLSQCLLLVVPSRVGPRGLPGGAEEA